MAVELLIHEKKTRHKTLVPVATQQVFRAFWKPGYEALSLKIVPLLEDGLFEQSDLPALAHELRQLKEWFNANQPPSTAQALATRIDLILMHLNKAITNPENYEVY